MAEQLTHTHVHAHTCAHTHTRAHSHCSHRGMGLLQLPEGPPSADSPPHWLCPHRWGEPGSRRHLRGVPLIRRPGSGVFRAAYIASEIRPLGVQNSFPLSRCDEALPPWIHPFSLGRPLGRLPVWAARNKASVDKAFAGSVVIPEGRPPGGVCRAQGVSAPWLSVDAVRPRSEGAVTSEPGGTS